MVPVLGNPPFPKILAGSASAAATPRGSVRRYLGRKLASQVMENINRALARTIGHGGASLDHP